MQRALASCVFASASPTSQSSFRSCSPPVRRRSRWRRISSRRHARGCTTSGRCSRARSPESLRPIARAGIRSAFSRVGRRQIFSSRLVRWVKQLRVAEGSVTFSPVPASFVFDSPTVNVHGPSVGTNKIDHFFQQGYEYYEQVVRAQARGTAGADAFVPAFTIGVTAGCASTPTAWTWWRDPVRASRRPDSERITGTGCRRPMKSPLLRSAPSLRGNSKRARASLTDSDRSLYFLSI
jgi:hypothetical protein